MTVENTNQSFTEVQPVVESNAANPETDGKAAPTQAPANDKMAFQGTDGTVREFTAAEVVHMVGNYPKLQTQLGQQSNELGNLRKIAAANRGPMAKGAVHAPVSTSVDPLANFEITSDDIADPNSMTQKVASLVQNVRKTTKEETLRDVETLEYDRKYDNDRVDFITSDPRLKQMDPGVAGDLFDQAMGHAEAQAALGATFVGRGDALDQYLVKMGYQAAAAYSEVLQAPVAPVIAPPGGTIEQPSGLDANGQPITITPTPQIGNANNMQNIVKTITNATGERQVVTTNGSATQSAGQEFLNASFDDQVKMARALIDDPEQDRVVKDFLNSHTKGTVITEENKGTFV